MQINMSQMAGITRTAGADAGIEETLLGRECFTRVVSRERKRAERSGESMLLLVLDISSIAYGAGKEEVLALMSGPLQAATRETDACGWIESGEQVGMVFTGITGTIIDQARRTIVQKVRECLDQNLDRSIILKVGLSAYTFPEKRGDMWDGNQFNRLFYPEIMAHHAGIRVNESMKRAMDVIGSLVALVLFSPLLLVISALIKCTSPGPVIFKQERLGQFGKPFNFLKFRTMYTNSNDSIHREFIRNFIANKTGDGDGTENGDVIFKIRSDPRVTGIGAFLRKSSLDELPQLLNVLRGEMSLVGPRPPIPYEVEDYAAWHRYRIIAKKPGITGLWQVKGRSLTAFDGMVRLDLRYIRSWSLWLDIKLLLATPMAVLRGKGAY